MSVRRAGSIAVLSLAGLMPGACGVASDDASRRVPPDELPSALRPSDSPVETTAVNTASFDVWFVREQRLIRSSHEIESSADAAALLAELLAGPELDEQERGLRSAIPDPSAVVGVVVSRGFAAVTITGDFADIPAADQVLAVGQIVLTLTDLRGIGRVEFVVEGTPVAVPLPSGESTDRSVSRDDYLPLTANG